MTSTSPPNPFALPLYEPSLRSVLISCGTKFASSFSTVMVLSVFPPFASTYPFALSPEIRPNTTISATAFPPNLLAPCTPPTTSPAA